MSNSFKLDLLDLNENAEVVKMGEKYIYNTDDKKTIKAWMEREKPKNDIILPVMKSALTVVDEDKRGSSLAVGYINNDSNNLQQQNVVHLMSSVCKANGNKAITKEMFLVMMTGFSVRRIVAKNWVNQNDEYLAPNEEHEEFEQFKYDSLVYSLFNNASYQTSLRQVEYKDKLWDIKNEFFWLSVDKMKELADQEGFSDLYFDAKTDSNRHVHNLLFGEERIYDKLSPDAKAVLDKATELVEKSMRMRQLMADNENHLKAWDAGYAQLKLVWKEYHSDEFKEFRELYKALEERMRPLVYELGFLLK